MEGEKEDAFQGSVYADVRVARQTHDLYFLRDRVGASVGSSRNKESTKRERGSRWENGSSTTGSSSRSPSEFR